MLYLGDNAYFFGDDPTYHSVFFSPTELQEFHRRQPFFSAAGNHEGFVSGFDSIAQTGDYFDMFEFPTGNELGVNGVASGSEAYYSFDYGNIHFIVLDSEENIEQHATAGAAMLTWLQNDLLATTADWIVVAWHRPPYSRGWAHDSDVEQQEIDMREQVVPILDAHGVDLVLSGHSHTYERTPLIDGHYGLSDTLEGAHLLDPGNGDPGTDGAYRKASLGQGPNEGTIFIVNGAAADVRTFNPGPHPVMVQSIVSIGTSIIEVDGDVLTGTFLNDTGAVLDTFSIVKGVTASSQCPAAPASGCVTDGKVGVVLKNNADAAKRKAKVKVKAAITDQGLDLNASADIFVCLYGNSSLVFDQKLPNAAGQGYPTVDPPSTSWTYDTSKPGKYKYDDKAQSVEGIRKMGIKTGAKGNFQTKASGTGMTFPAFPIDEPLALQVFNGDGDECWDIPITTVKKNEAAKGLSAKGP